MWRCYRQIQIQERCTHEDTAQVSAASNCCLFETGVNRRSVWGGGGGRRACLPQRRLLSPGENCLQIPNMCNFIYALTAIISPSFTALCWHALHALGSSGSTCILYLSDTRVCCCCVCAMCRLAHCFVFGCSCKLLPTRVLFRVRCGLNSSSPGLFMLLLLLLLLFLLFDKLLLTPFRRCCCCCCVARCMCAHYARLQLLQLQQQQQQ